MALAAGAPHAHRGRGRPYRLPEDQSPISALAGGSLHRTAWLLGSWRLHARDEVLTKRTGFVAALNALDVPCDATRLSRWESGRVAVPPRVIDAYETLIGLTPGQLRVPLRRVNTSDSTAHDVPRAPAEAHQQLDELFEEVLAGGASGKAWLVLVDLLTQDPHVYLLSDTWRQVSELLTDELSRSAGLAYAARLEALKSLVAHPTSRHHGVRSVGKLVTNAALEYVVHPLSLLDTVTDPQGTQLLLKLLSSGPTHLRAGAAWASATRALHGRFDAAELGLLEDAAVSMLQSSRRLVHRVDAMSIHAHLPEASQERINAALPEGDIRDAVTRATETGELHATTKCRALVSRVAERAQSSTSSAVAVEPDMMLRRLVREALCHVSQERRYQAALLLAASPYRQAVAGELVKLVEDNDESLSVHALATATQVAGPEERQALFSLAVQHARKSVRINALLALGAIPGNLTIEESAVLSGALSEDGGRPLDRATIHCLGMGGSPQLEELSAGPGPHAPAAAWWLQASDPIREPMVLV